ncbi:MAG: RNA polymerase sigma factor [Anaerolineales bacterium]
MTSALSVTPDEQTLLAALRAGDEAAFMGLVERYHTSLVRLAATFVGSTAVAEDVAQETWAKALRSLNSFEGRSSLKTWLFRILTNTALTTAKREARTISFSDFESPDGDEPAVEPERFLQNGEWAQHPQRWETGSAEDIAIRRETLAQVQQAIAALPETQRAVITLHDIEGWESKDICNVLAISETNQRVLLHRARSKVRRALEHYFVEMMP